MKNTNNKPFYHLLYRDMIRDKYPEKAHLCSAYLEKTDWNSLDVIQVNKILFENEKDKKGIAIDQKHRAYDMDSIKAILREQRDNNMYNCQIANKYRISRNTISKWKLLFPELV